MAAPYTPTIPAQIRYILQWFREWGEMQRGDFLPIIVESFAEGAVRINGLISGLEHCNTNDEDRRPPSLFQCRVKLFQEWSRTWNNTDKEQVLTGIRSVDPEFGEKYDQESGGSLSDENKEQQEEIAVIAHEIVA